MNALTHIDPEIAGIISKEENRQQYKLNMIPSENFPSRAVREAVGSVLMNKYSEGEISKRYYEGNQFIDQMETVCKQRLLKLFQAPLDWEVNVHGLTGSIANLAVYISLLSQGDTIMSMYLPDGGHISHGWSFEPDKDKRDTNAMIYRGGSRKISFVSKLYSIVQYKTNPETEVFDYDQIREIAIEEKPKLIISGGTAYPQEINHERLAEIAHTVGAYYFADIAHEAGLVAAGVNKSPIGLADVVTMTTHKTFRGPRGAVIFAKREFSEQIDRALHHALLGGPFNNNIAGIAVAAKEAMKPAFKRYAHQVVINAQTLAKILKEKGFYLVSGGTKKHLLLVNLRKSRHDNIIARQFAKALDYAGIVVNYNTVPQEAGSPLNPSGIRLGTPIVTTRGMKEKEMEQIADWFLNVAEIVANQDIKTIGNFIKTIRREAGIQKIAAEVKELCKKFPLEM